MKTYICHKEVKAAKIVEMMTLSSGETAIRIDDGTEGGDGVHVSAEWMALHPKCEVGGWLVEYEDGYLSWSPAKAFEDGYTEVAEEF